MITALNRIGTRKIVITLFIIACLPYLFWITNEFVSIDDGSLIYKNGAVLTFSLRSVRYIFSSYDPELYIPLTLFTYQILHALFGLNPVVFHLTSILLHAGNAVLLFFVSERVLKNRAASFLAALLFALHPLQSESVYWAAALKDLLSTCFFLASILSYLKFAQTSEKRSYRLSLLFFLLALLSKVTIITLPVILLLLDWYEGRGLLTRIKEKIPYFALSIIFGIIAIRGKAHVLESSSFTENILLGMKSTAFYLTKLLWPFEFSIIYPQNTEILLLSTEFFIPALICVLLLTLALLAWKKFPLVAFTLAFFFITIIPNFTNFNKNGFLFFASDRYAYVPFIAIFLLIGSIGDALFRKSRIGEIGTDVLLLSISWLTYAQGMHWQHSRALYENVLSQYPASALARNNYADILVKQGHLDDALVELEKAITIDPELTPAYLNRGNIFRERGKIEDAIIEYKKAISIVENKTLLMREDLGPYYMLAETLGNMGKTEESLALFTLAAEKGGYEEAYYNLGIQYQKYGRYLEAKEALEIAVEKNMEFIPAHYNLAAVYGELGMLTEAERELLEVYKRAPNYEKTRAHLENIRRILKSQ